jgi:hypothetical protein
MPSSGRELSQNQPDMPVLNIVLGRRLASDEAPHSGPQRRIEDGNLAEDVSDLTNCACSPHLPLCTTGLLEPY